MQKKRNLPFQKWFWGDWFKAPDVQSQPPEIRCLWFEMIGRMHESEEYGVLLFNGIAPTDEEMAQVFGYGRDKGGVNRDVNRLVKAGVCTRRENDGAIVCRRMVKDESKRRIDENNGKLGGNPKLGDKGGVNPPVNPSVKYDFCNMTSESEPAKGGAGGKPPKVNPRARNEIFDFVAMEFAIDPEVQGSRIGKLSSQFKKLLSKTGAGTDEIKRRRANYRAKWPNAADTAEALVKHWGEMDVKQEETHERYARIIREGEAAIVSARNREVGKGSRGTGEIPDGREFELAGSPDRREDGFECPGVE